MLSFLLSEAVQELWYSYMLSFILRHVLIWNTAWGVYGRIETRAAMVISKQHLHHRVLLPPFHFL